MRNHDEPLSSEQPTQRPQPSRSVPLSMLAGLSVLALLAGGGAAWWTWNSVNPPSNSQAPTIESPTSQVSPSPAEPVPAGQTVQVYWLKTVGDRIEPTASPVTINEDEPKAVLETAFQTMLEGSTDPELTSTVPEGTTLKSLDIREDGVHVDLSQEFTTGGGSASMTGRLAQVIYTASTLNPAAPVWISVEGEPLEVLGGEGLIVDQPMTRADFEQNFSL